MNVLPSSQNLVDPLLRVLNKSVNPMTNRELEVGVIDYLEIPDELVKLVHSGKRTELQYRLAWARTKAKSEGYICSPRREVWQLTLQGHKFLGS